MGHESCQGASPLHGPLESCIPRRSCHPSQRERPQPRCRPHGTAAFGARYPSPPNSASDRKHGAALMVRLLAYGRQGRVRAASCRAGWRCQRSAWLCGVLSTDGKASIGEAPLADPRHQQLCRISRAGIRGEGSGRGGGKEAPIKRPRRVRAAHCLCKRLFRLRTGYAPTSKTRRSRARSLQHSAR